MSLQSTGKTRDVEVDKVGGMIVGGAREVREDDPVTWTYEERQLREMFNAELSNLEPLGQDLEERETGSPSLGEYHQIYSNALMRY